MMEKSFACSICGCRIQQRDNAGDGNTPLCLSYYQRYYTYCIRCGTLLRSGDARYSSDDPDCEESLCRDCYKRLEPSKEA